MIHTVEGFLVVNEAEVDVFLEFPCFLHDPVNVGNLISGFSAFSKPSLWPPNSMSLTHHPPFLILVADPP